MHWAHWGQVQYGDRRLFKQGRRKRKSTTLECRESPENKMTIHIVSEKQNHSQSVSPRVQPNSSLAQWLSFLVMCLYIPLGVSSPWHPALAAV